MDATTVTQISFFIGIVLTILASAWLNQRSSERIIEALRNEIKAEIQSVRAEIQSVRAEIKTLEKTLENTNERLARVERQLDQVFKPVLPPR